MDINNLFLIAVALLNLLIGCYIYFKNWRSQLKFSFLLLTIGVALWSIGLALSNYINNGLEASLFWSRFTYIASGFIAFSFLWLTMLFPFDQKLALRRLGLLFSPFLFLLIITIISPSFIITSVNLQKWGYDASYNIIGYILFSFYFLFYVSIGFYYLIKRYLTLEGILKSNLRFLIIGIGISAIFGIVFDLILPFGNYWQLNWLGPYFTLFMVFSIAYMMSKK